MLEFTPYIFSLFVDRVIGFGLIFLPLLHRRTRWFRCAHGSSGPSIRDGHIQARRRRRDAIRVVKRQDPTVQCAYLPREQNAHRQD